MKLEQSHGTVKYKIPRGKSARNFEIRKYIPVHGLTYSLLAYRRNYLIIPLNSRLELSYQSFILYLISHGLLELDSFNMLFSLDLAAK